MSEVINTSALADIASFIRNDPEPPHTAIVLILFFTILVCLMDFTLKSFTISLIKILKSTFLFHLPQELP